MTVHRDYTWRIGCPACGSLREFRLTKDDHEYYVARFAVRVRGMVMVTHYSCPSCDVRLEVRKAMSTYGVMTVGLVNIEKREPEVDMKYPVEFTPPLLAFASP